VLFVKPESVKRSDTPSSLLASAIMNFLEDANDTLWLCWACGDLDQLSEDGLCRRCKPEPVAEFHQICVRVLAGEVRAAKRVWVIG